MEEKKPWGKLNGVHPTIFARNLIDKGVDFAFVDETLIKEYDVSPEKAKLVLKVLQNQNNIIRNDNLIDIYINIPICPSRCSFCSFISSEINSVKELIPKYIECLIKEIKAVKKIIQNKPYIVRSIYVGGGTPTVLKAEELEQILSEIQYPHIEFTVECGRAETITREKLEVLKKYGVTRISINPQTFTKKCLKNIGRNTSLEEILRAYKLAMEFGFEVNMDLIAGIEGEIKRTFTNNLKIIKELSPDNITIHTLALKKGSCLQGQEIVNPYVEEMISQAYTELTEEGYIPYYLYRLKNQLGDLENVGYCRPGKQCLYNIDSMEEVCSIIACGAHGISKRVKHFEKSIERQGNVKFIKDYIERIDKLIENKIMLFK